MKNPMTLADRIVAYLEAQDVPFRQENGLLRPTLFSPDQVRKAVIAIQREEDAKAASEIDLGMMSI